MSKAQRPGFEGGLPVFIVKGTTFTIAVEEKTNVSLCLLCKLDNDINGKYEIVREKMKIPNNRGNKENRCKWVNTEMGCLA